MYIIMVANNYVATIYGIRYQFLQISLASCISVVKLKLTI